MKLKDARRIILFNFNSETRLIEMRHYQIVVKTLGISKSVKSIINTNIPNLNAYSDISEFIMRFFFDFKNRGAYASESDVEEGPESLVSVKEAEQRAIKLFELGPRLNLKLIKIEDGLCGGPVIHHEYGIF